MITFKLVPTKTLGVCEYIAKNGDEIIGKCEFFISPEGIDINKLFCYGEDVRNVADGLIRSALFSAEQRGVTNARFVYTETNVPSEIVNSLGFVKTEGNECVSVTKALDSHCCSH